MRNKYGNRKIIKDGQAFDSVKEARRWIELCLLEKAGDAGKAVTPTLVTAEEAELARVLALFPETVKNALSEYEPSVITRYILDLCAAFNRFYHECQILSAEDNNVRGTRILLTEATKNVLGSAFSLICLKKTERI